MQELRADLQALRERLLSAEGNQVSCSSLVDEFAPRQMVQVLLTLGAFFPGHAELTRGESRSCHDNCRALAGTNPTYRWFAGFALSSDGVWRQHSWLQTSTGILETTTERRELYFGCAMPAEE